MPMRTALSVVTPPAVEPVTPENAKLHARIDLDVEDALVARWITAAREYAEEHTGRAWVNQTLLLTLDAWPCEAEVCLPREPVSAVNSVKYRDTDGGLTTLAADDDYQVWLEHSPPIVAPAPQTVWPALQTGRKKAVEIEFVAGYGAASGWPARADEAIYMTLTYWNRNRGDGRDPTMAGLPEGAIRLLDNLWTGTY